MFLALRVRHPAAPPARHRSPRQGRDSSQEKNSSPPVGGGLQHAFFSRPQLPGIEARPRHLPGIEALPSPRQGRDSSQEKKSKLSSNPTVLDSSPYIDVQTRVIAFCSAKPCKTVQNKLLASMYGRH